MNIPNVKIPREIPWQLVAVGIVIIIITAISLIYTQAYNNGVNNVINSSYCQSGYGWIGANR